MNGHLKDQSDYLGVPLDVTEECLEVFFSGFGKVEDVSAVVSTVGIATAECVLQITMACKEFNAS